MEQREITVNLITGQDASGALPSLECQDIISSTSEGEMTPARISGTKRPASSTGVHRSRSLRDHKKTYRASLATPSSAPVSSSQADTAFPTSVDGLVLDRAVNEAPFTGARSASTAKLRHSYRSTTSASHIQADGSSSSDVSTEQIPRVTCEEKLDDDDDVSPNAAQSCKRMRPSGPDCCSSGLFVEYLADGEITNDSSILRSEQSSEEPPHNAKDFVNAWGLYDREILEHALLHEEQSQAPWGYMGSSQKDLHPDHRRIMVNWLVEFAEEFDLECETLSLGVGILDRYLCDGPPVKKTELQLLGTACMLVAVKFQECQPPDMIYCCCQAAEGTFSHEQVLQMELSVLNTIKFDCTMPTVHTFLWHHLKAVDAQPQLEHVANYLACLSLLEYDLLEFHPSVRSAASVMLASSMLKQTSWFKDSEVLLGYSATCLHNIQDVLQKTIILAEKPALSALKTKFQKKEYFEVASFVGGAHKHL